MITFKMFNCEKEVGLMTIPKPLLVKMNWGDEREFCCVKHAELYFEYQKDVENLSERDFMWKYNKPKPPAYSQ